DRQVNLMHASAAAHKHRHFKTLILLVISMTFGAFFLFWLGRLTPVVPLRGKAKPVVSWNGIAVRTAQADVANLGFFHYRIDAAGQLWQTSAWKAHAQDPKKPGTIEIVLNVRERAEISSSQERALAKLV